MKSLLNRNAKDWKQAAALSQQARRNGQQPAFAGGGTDLLGMVKERTASPDVLVNLKSIPGQDQISTQVTLDGTTPGDGDIMIGGLITLDALSNNPLILHGHRVLAEAAGSVATPQIRNFGTLAGNVCQRPWCWYFRNGFPCYKAGGKQCFSVNGENQFHAILGGGPSFIVHPSDTAPALVALEATFHVVGPKGKRTIAAKDFFVLPKQNAAQENSLKEDEILASVHLPAPKPGTRSAYHKELDREAWTHAVVSAAVVLEMDKKVCRRARIVLGGVAPIPWHVPDAERLLVGQTVTDALAHKVAEVALAGANPLAKNAYKVPLMKAIVKRTLLGLG